MATNKELNPDSIFNQDYNDVREIYRMIVLYGCFSGSDIDNAKGTYPLPLREDGKSEIRKSLFSKRARQLTYLLPDTYLKYTDGKIKNYYVDNDIYQNNDDVLLKTYKMHNFTENQIMYYFLLLQVCILRYLEEEGPFTLNSLSDFIVSLLNECKENLPDAIQSVKKALYNASEKKNNREIDDTSSIFRSYFTDMVDAGYFIKTSNCNIDHREKGDSSLRSDYYIVAKDRLNDLYNCFEDNDMNSLYLLLNHLTKSNALSAPYYLAKERLLTAFDYESNFIDSKNKFLFRHNPVYSILDNEVMYNLLKAIKRKKTCSITYKETNADYSADNEYNKNTMVILPRYILSNEEDGRCFVIGINHKTKAVISLRLDYITTITETGTFPVSSNDLQLLKGIENNIDKIWCASAYRFQKDIIPLIVTFTFSEQDTYLKRQFLQEVQRFTYEELDEHTYKATFEIFDIIEMKPWLRKFGKRIQIQENSITAKQVKKELESDWKEMAKIYGII